MTSEVIDRLFAPPHAGTTSTLESTMRKCSSAISVAVTLASVCALSITQLFAADWNYPASGSSPTTHDSAGASKSASARPSGAVGPQLRRLDWLAGQWTVRQSMWTDPAKPPAVDNGSAAFTAVLGGRHLRQDLRVDSAGKPFEGLGYIGYDNATGKYDSLWMDVNFTGMIMAHGDYDAVKRTYTFTGAVPDPALGGAMSPLREVMQVRDADHFVYEYYERHGGREALVIRLEYTRAK